MVYNFTRDTVKILISLYEQYPDLYNVSSPGYKNKNSRLEHMQIIATQLNEILGNSEPRITEQDVQKKIDILRTQFFSELRSAKKSKTSGTGADSVYKSNWWCFNELRFLLSNPVRQGESNLEDHNVETYTKPETILERTVDELETLVMTEDEQLLSPTPTELSRPSTSCSNTRKRKRNYDKDDDRKLLELAATSLMTASSSSSTNDHIETFGMMVIAEMKRIKTKQKVLALKRTIMNAIYEVLEEQEGDE